MPQKDKPDAMLDCVEPLPFKSVWSSAEFLALEGRWSFLERIGERKIDTEGKDPI
jgi:hypothetical protein